MAEAAKADSKLNGIDAGIRSSQPGVGNVHEAHFSADVVFAPQEVEADGAAGGEIDAGSAFGDFGIGKESAAAKLEVGNDAAAVGQHPLEGERIDAGAVGGVRFLNDEENGDGVDGIFQTAAEKPRAMGIGENQAVTEADVPNAVAGLGAVGAVASASPYLNFVAARDRAGLGACQRGTEENDKDEGCEESSHRCVSLKLFELDDRWLGSKKI